MKRPGAIVMLTVGIVLSLIGFTLASAGAAAAWLGAAQRDGGYFTSRTERFTVPSFALVSPHLDAVGEGTPERLPFDVGTLRLRATAADPEQSIFIGIAPREDVDRYLAGVHYTELQEVKFNPFRPVYLDVSGLSSPASASSQDIWVASASGQGLQELTWKITPGTWTVVVMNSDAAQGVSADLQAGFRSELIRPAATGLLVAGGLALVVGLPLLVIGAVGLGRRGTPGPPPPAGPAGRGPAPSRSGSPAPGGSPPAITWDQAHPVRLTGHVDAGLSRGLWLVKWLLAIPHFFVLFFLWFAFAVTTVVAWFAILFTGRYPQSLFHFNVGVLRWTWRVAFYAYAAGGTDKYPPFTLEHADYPATLDVQYPQRLSRGLVLVKSWLLLIPHWLVIGAVTGSATWAWRTQDGPAGVVTERGGGLSLLALLVLIALVILLFSGRYPRPLFAFIMGINRWAYRVVVYGALMRDEYPPFRLDQGPDEPDPAAPRDMDPRPAGHQGPPAGRPGRPDGGGDRG
ncbi:DUF4389 domain-containing protein [Paenarthrobacter ureafaciens]|uniref:DUF4389 domain-containing protein n=1 Tax=Paenarthrobacter ureafaciens TaxID=37931 RepID=UPI001FB53DE7|nr:DUF4389 domain-containing protein [Paenarthrobacter ureafaciens]UOD82942.1 DUF4389 domain-containing protein [Paenarthrobacter ureafaciens]WNZ02649.1 DUF4389 domain-containing protein [Paenarthrobacter ureafaciens]